jgi:hypothetical protein
VAHRKYSRTSVPLPATPLEALVDIEKIPKTTKKEKN